MLLLISAVLGVLPLLGVVWILLTPMRATVDGLFMSLILLTLSGIFTLNLYWEMRDRGMLNFLKKKKKPRRPRRRLPRKRVEFVGYSEYCAGSTWYACFGGCDPACIHALVA